MNPVNIILNKHKMFLSKIKLWVTGIGLYYTLTWLYDYVMVSFLLIYFGFLRGSIIVFISSILVDLVTIRLYDYWKKDWLALETIKDLENKNNFIGKIFKWVHGKGSVLTIVILSLTSNAFVVTAYMRKGSYEYNGMGKRDWIVFLTSSVLINLYWIFVVGGGIELFRYLKNILL